MNEDESLNKMNGILYRSASSSLMSKEDEFPNNINELARKERIWAAEEYVQLLMANISRNETDYGVVCPPHLKTTIHRCLNDFKELDNVVRMVIDGKK